MGLFFFTLSLCKNLKLINEYAKRENTHLQCLFHNWGFNVTWIAGHYPVAFERRYWGVKREINIGEALKLNAFASRRKKVGEITKRFKHVKPSVWQRFMESDEQEQMLILYYACLKTYDMLKDFQIDFLLKKWLNYSLEYDKYVFLDFLFRQSATHPEIDAWTDETKDKLSSVVNVMLTKGPCYLHQRMVQGRWKFQKRL